MKKKLKGLGKIRIPPVSSCTVAITQTDNRRFDFLEKIWYNIYRK